MRITKPCLFVILASIALGFASNVGAATVSVHPSVIVADDNGAILGPVVGFQTSGRPMIMIADPTQPAGSPRGVVIQVEQTTLSTQSDFQVYYSLENCDGTAYLEPASERSGLAEMTDINYSFGLNAADEIVLFKASGASSSTGYLSRYRSTTADFTVPSSGCSNISGTIQLVPATEVLNISTDRPPPYGVLFPGLD